MPASSASSLSSSTLSAPVQIIPHMEANLDFTLFSCSWVPCSARFVVMGSRLDGRGAIRVMTMANTELTTLSEAPASAMEKAVKCGTFAASSMEDRNLVTGDFGGNLCLWDLERLEKPVLSLRAHEQLINAVDGIAGLGTGSGAPEIATASRDGNVKVWDLRVRDRAVACMQPSSESQRRDAWAVAMGNDHGGGGDGSAGRTLASGYDNGDVKMFDLRRMGVHWETELPSGVCSLEFDRRDGEMNKLAATCLEGRIHVWDLRTLHPEEGFARLDQGLTGRGQQGQQKSTVWCGRHLPQNRDVLMTAAGGGSSLALWQYKYPENRSKDGRGVTGELVRLQDLDLGEQPVSCFSWSPDKTGLGLCTSFDQKVRTVIVTKLNTL